MQTSDLSTAEWRALSKRPRWLKRDPGCFDALWAPRGIPPAEPVHARKQVRPVAFGATKVVNTAGQRQAPLRQRADSPILPGKSDHDLARKKRLASI